MVECTDDVWKGIHYINQPNDTNRKLTFIRTPPIAPLSSPAGLDLKVIKPRGNAGEEIDEIGR